MKICVLGCGDHSKAVHGPSYAKYKQLHPDVELAACCDLSLAAAEAYVLQFGFARCYTDLAEMLRAEAPDLVGVIMPVDITERMCKQVLAAGVSALAEKPPAMTGDGVRALVQAAKTAPGGAQLRIAFNRRFMPLVRAMRREIEALGDAIQLIDYRMHRVGRGDEDFSTTAIHGIDLVACVAGEPYEQAAIAYQPAQANGKSGDIFYIDARFASGGRARMDFVPLTGCLLEEISVHTAQASFFITMPNGIYGGNGSLDVYVRGEHQRHYTGADMEDGTAFFESNGFYYEVASFIELLSRGEINTEGLVETTVQSVELAQAVRERRAQYP